MVLPVRIELTTSPLPRGCSTTELRQPGPFAVAEGDYTRTRPVASRAADPDRVVVAEPKQCNRVSRVLHHGMEVPMPRTPARIALSAFALLALAACAQQQAAAP